MSKLIFDPKYQLLKAVHLWSDNQPGQSISSLTGNLSRILILNDYIAFFFPFSTTQIEQLVEGLIGIGDKNGDKRITFDEYVHMSHDVFVNNFAPRNLRRVFRNY